jgi:hypothetical protein
MVATGAAQYVVGYCLMLIGAGIGIASFLRRESDESPTHDLHVEYDVDLEEHADAPLVVRNDNPFPVFDVQITALENAGKMMTFELIPSIGARDRASARHVILDQLALQNPRYATMKAFLSETIVFRNVNTFHQELIETLPRPPQGMFADVVIPFHVTFRQGRKVRLSRHRLSYNPTTHRAVVRTIR